MKLRSYARSRWQRGFQLATLGPNEARIMFDFVVAALALVAALLFRRMFLPTDPVPIAALLLPFLFVGVAAACGIYTRLKLAQSNVKALVLMGAVVAVSVGSSVLIREVALITLWALLTMPTVVFARILLSLPFSRHVSVARLAVTQHGPVLVLGGAGYIGSLTVELLLKRGHSVRVLDRLMYGAESVRPFIGNSRFELIEGDATDIAKLTAATRNAAAVIQLAGLVGDPACAVDAAFTRHTNIVATRMSREVAQSLGVHRFIFASSCSVYGASDREMREGDSLNPVSLYAQTKIDCERELLYGTPDQFFVTVLRFATVFGHSRRPRFDLVANLFAAQAMTSGHILVIGPDQWRPFVHVSDLARAIVMTLEAPPEQVQSQIFNVGDDRLNMTIGQLGEVVQRIVSPFRQVIVDVRNDIEDRRNYRVSFDKIRDILGFRCEVMLEDGIREILEHLRSGTYGDFHRPVYSNVATTQAALLDFYESSGAGRLYGPLNLRGVPSPEGLR